MVSIEQSFDMFDRHIKMERDHYSRYPPLPQQALFGAPMDMPMHPDSFAPFASADAFPAASMVPYDPSSLYADASHHNTYYNNNGRSSPAVPGTDERSSNLSTASAP